MSDSLLYLDSSGIAKLVLVELESAALIQFLTAWPLRASSALARVEVGRAIRRAGGGVDAMMLVDDIMRRFILLDIDATILESAARLDPLVLRTLDAIHLASALSLGGNLGGFVAYDLRLAQAAAAHGMRVFAPGSPAGG